MRPKVEVDARTRPVFGEGARLHCALESLPVGVLHRVLRELPPRDLREVVRVSSRLRDLSQDCSLDQEEATLGPDSDITWAVHYIRLNTTLKSLILHDRQDTDAVLMEVARLCRGLQSLELVRCRGSSVTSRLSFVPLMRMARRCTRLRRLLFRETEFLCSRVFKIWADRHGPQDPPLDVGLHCLSRRQAAYMTTVLNAPPELYEYALQGTPFWLRVHDNVLHVQGAEASWTCDAGMSTPRQPSSPLPAARVRPAPSATSSGTGNRKRPRLEIELVEHTDEVQTVFARALACSASTSTGLPGPQKSPVQMQGGSCSSADESEGENMDFMVDSPDGTSSELELETDGAQVQSGIEVDTEPSPARPERPASTRRGYKSLFGMGRASEPLFESWFRAGFMPDFGEQQAAAEHTLGDSGVVRTMLLDSEDGEDSLQVEVTAVVEESGLAALSTPRTGLVPASAVRLADSLKEPLDADRQSGDSQDPQDPEQPTKALVQAGQSDSHRNPVDGDHGAAAQDRHQDDA